MMHLAKNDEQVVVVNVFTDCGDGKNTVSAKRYLEQCGYDDAKVLYEERKREDARVLKNIGASVVNLSFIDALWRERNRSIIPFVPEFRTLYPTYRLHISKGRLHKQDLELKKKLTSELKKIAAKYNAHSVFAPMGIGNHVDHVLVREAVKDMNMKNTFYWEDYPYNVGLKLEEKNSLIFEPDWEKKQKLIRMYKTQYKSVFPHGVVEMEEIFRK